MQDLLVIFDVEGTLVDSVALTLRCWQETLQAAGFEIPIAVLQRHSGEDPDEMLRALLPASGVKLAEQIKKAQGACFRERYLPKVKPFPQVRPLLERIKAGGGRIGLATTCAPDELQHYLALLNISDLLYGVATGEAVKHEKPHPDLVQVALERCGGVPPARAVMVGDTPYDAIAARRAGASAVGVLTGGFSERDLKAAGCSEVFADPADMIARAGFAKPLQQT
jgi:phosphoglycolate phosphatase-like HAD superfamily hydrolase